MTQDDWIAIIVTLIISAALVVLGIVLIKGKGAFLIAGYNTMPKTEKEKYRGKLLCRSVGILLIVVAGLLPAGIIASLFRLYLISVPAFVAIPVIVVVSGIYINVSEKYKW